MSTSVTCTSTKAVEIRWEKGSSRGFFKLFQFLSLSCTFVRTSKLKVKTRDRARYSELQYSVSNQKGNMIKLKEKKKQKTGDIKWLAGGASRYLFGSDDGIFLLVFFSY